MAEFFSHEKQPCYPSQVHILRQGAKLISEDLVTHQEVFEAFITEDSVDQKVEALLQRIECPELCAEFKQLIDDLWYMPHKRTCLAASCELFKRLLDFLEDPCNCFMYCTVPQS